MARSAKHSLPEYLLTYQPIQWLNF